MKKLLIVFLLSISAIHAAQRCVVYSYHSYNGRNYSGHMFVTMHSSPQYFTNCQKGNSNNPGQRGNCNCEYSESYLTEAEVESGIIKGMKGQQDIIAQAVAKKINEQFGKQLEENKKANFDALARIKQDVVKLLNDIQSIFFE